MKRKIFLFLVIILGFHGAVPRNAIATVMVGSVVRSTTYGVNVNYFTNSGYIEQDKPFWYGHTAEGLVAVRTQLVKSGKLEEIPILISIPSPVFLIYPEHTEISRERNCEISYGETGDPPENIGRCYKIHYVGEDSYSNFLSLLVALSLLQSDGEKITQDELKQYQDDLAGERNELRGITRHFSPLWSPNSRYVVYTVWQDGNITYQVKDVTRDGQIDVTLTHGNPVNVPLWSPDSRYMAVASLSSVAVFDTEKSNSVSIDLPKAEKTVNFETLLSFDPTADRLLIARDTNLLSNYEFLSYNLKTNELTQLASDVNRPEWEDAFQVETYLRKDRSTSPSGVWEARIKKENNTSQIVVENILGVTTHQTEKQADLEGTNSTDSRSNYRNIVLFISAAVIFFACTVMMVLIKGRSKKTLPKTEVTNEVGNEKQ